MKRKYVTFKGMEIAYYDEGKGKPIFMIHGFPDSADVWRKIIPGLVNAGYRVIAPDLRGFGESKIPNTKAESAIPMILEDILSLKSYLNIEEPVKLIAHDWGANIGWMLISFYPEEFESYVPISVGHPYAYAMDGGFEQKKKGWYTMMFLFEGMAETLFSQNDWAAFRVFTQNHPELDTHWLPDMRREGRFTAALNLYRANLEPLEKSIEVPRTSVDIFGFYGLQDLYLSETQMSASGKYVNGSFNYKSIDGGHWLPLDRPEVLLNNIIKFYKNR